MDVTDKVKALSCLTEDCPISMVFKQVASCAETTHTPNLYFD